MRDAKQITNERNQFVHAITKIEREIDQVMNQHHYIDSDDIIASMEATLKSAEAHIKSLNDELTEANKAA